MVEWYLCYTSCKDFVGSTRQMQSDIAFHDQFCNTKYQASFVLTVALFMRADFVRSRAFLL